MTLSAFNVPVYLALRPEVEDKVAKGEFSSVLEEYILEGQFQPFNMNPPDGGEPDGVAVLSGTSGNDIITNFTTSNEGVVETFGISFLSLEGGVEREFDTLYAGTGTDVLFLGFGTDPINPEPQTFYLGKGDSDYALIVGFDEKEDILLLGGDPSSYKQEVINFSGEGFGELTSLEISFKAESGEDRIAIIASLDSPLNVNADDMIFPETFILEGNPPLQISHDKTNQLYKGSNGDEIFASWRNGSLEDDILDMSAGEDLFFLDKNDFFLGANSHRTFFIDAEGSNTITGDANSDAFWIANTDLPVNSFTKF